MDKWRIWDDAPSYGDTLYQRAIGELPEMESSKCVAKEIKRVFNKGDTLLDVGCGAGHYLRSLRRELGDFSYTGVDATKYYVELATKAFKDDSNAKFHQADIFNLDVKDASFNIVTCNNVLLHLPSIAKPLSELVRAATRKVVVRFLCGDRSFIVKDVRPPKDATVDDIDENGEPASFNFYNIYSKDYVGKILKKLPRVKNWTIKRDDDFNPQNIMKSGDENKGAYNSSKMVGEFQTNGYILLPWAILEIDL